MQSFIAYHPVYRLPLPEDHRFPMDKYELLPQQLLREGIVKKSDFFEPQPVDKEFLNGVHDPKYMERLFNLELDKKEIRRIGFPLIPELVDRELIIIDGTIKTAEIALESGIGFNISGGTHHAGYDFGEGFCVLNDQAVAANYLIKHKNQKKILIIDLDVHQGNGTADIFKDDDSVFTFSMHGQKNFPFKKEISDLDVGLDDGIEGAEYLERLKSILNQLIPKVKPDFIFFQSGVDVLETDRMGRLKLTAEDCRQRDILVFETCKKHGIPVQVSMGGGYSPQLRNIIDAHANTFKEGIRIMK